MARPKKTYHEKRTEQLNIGLTLHEIEQIRARAETAGLIPVDYARKCLLGHVVKPAKRHADAALISELNRIGVNLNQIMPAFHTNKLLRKDWSPVVAQLQAVLKKVAACYDR